MGFKVRPTLGDAQARLEALTARTKSSSRRISLLFESKTVAPAAMDGEEPVALQTALEELRLQNEELRGAEEDLRQQLDELVTVTSELARARAQVSEQFDHTPLAQAVTDRFAVIQTANTTAAGLLGFERHDLRGKPLTSFVAPPDVMSLTEALDALSLGDAVELDLTLVTRERQPVRVAAHVTMSVKDRTVYFTFGILDEARRPSCDPTARALRDKEELLQRERRARETLERANRAKDRFIAVLAHDLRAPLNAVLGWTQMLRTEILDRDGRDRALATIERNGRNQLHLIEELLDISRIDAGRVQLDLTPVDLGVIVQRHVETTFPSARTKGISLVAEVEPDLMVVADRLRLDQVLSNLVANAIKFTPEDGSIALSAVRSGQRVRVSVSDTGRGVDPKLLPHVFEMYLQERNHSSSRSGLGLGLYIVKQIVELHGGSVFGESEGAGRGATFGFELPFRGSGSGAVAAPISEQNPLLTPDLGHLRILVVDDDEDSRDLAAAVLRRARAKVSTAKTLDAAVEVFDFAQPDVLVSDLVLADGDGVELVRRLRRRQKRPFAALVVTAFGAAPDDGRLAAAGFDAHVEKPFDTVDLIDAVVEAASVRQIA